MKIIVENRSSHIEIIIEQNIKSISDNDDLRVAIEDVWRKNRDKPIRIYIKDSFIITSSVIGFLIKCIKRDKIDLSLYISNSELYEMLDDMSLIQELNIKRVV